MTKFIACEDGSYINVDHISAIQLQQYGKVFHVQVIYNDFDTGASRYIITDLSNEQAQEWLDNFMKEHQLI